MTFSKINTKLTLGLLLSTSLLLQGCGDLFKEKGQALDNSATFSQGAPFYVSKIDVEATGLSNKPDELGLINKKQFRFTACLSTVTGGSLTSALRNFEVNDGVNKLNSIVDTSGCVLWKEEIEYDIYGPQKYYRLIRNIVGKDGMAGTYKVNFLLDPYGNTTVYDPARVVPVPDGSVAVEEPGANGFSNKIVSNPNDLNGQTLVGLDAISLSQLRHADDYYEIDKNLNLTIAHKYRVTFNPSILRQSFGSLYDELKAKQGKVRAVIMFFRDDKSNPNLQDYDNYITSLEHDFTINPTLGTIKEDVIFKWPDISSLVTRLRVLVKIQPLVGSASVKAAYFEGNIQSLPGNSIDLMNTRYNVDTVLTKFKEIEARAQEVALDPLDYFLAAKKTATPLVMLNDSDLDCNPSNVLVEFHNECDEIKRQGFKSYLSSLINSGQAPRKPVQMGGSQILNLTLKVLAEKAGLEYRQMDLINSKVYVTTFVESILQKNPTLGAVSTTKTFNTGLNFGMSTGTNTSFNKHASMSAGVGFDLFSLIGGSYAKAAVGKALEGAKSRGIGPSLGISVGVGNSWSYSSAVSDSQSIGVSDGYAINWRSREITVRAMVKDCAIIETGGNSFAPEKFRRFTGVYCGESYAKEFKETFYFLSDSAPTDNFQDGGSVNDRTWIMMLRGAPYWNLFRGFMENRQINLKQVSKLTMRRDAGVVPKDVFDAIDAHKVSEIKNMRTTQVAPGMIMDMSLTTPMSKRASETARIKREVLQLEALRDQRIKYENTVTY